MYRDILLNFSKPPIFFGLRESFCPSWRAWALASVPLCLASVPRCLAKVHQCRSWHALKRHLDCIWAPNWPPSITWLPFGPTNGPPSGSWAEFWYLRQWIIILSSYSYARLR